MSPPPAQLIVYAFGPDAGFEGQLVGALERMEVGGAVRILEVLFVQKDRELGRLVAFEHHDYGAGGIAGELVSFRLDQAERARATERALDGVAGRALRELGEGLEPGAALAAVFLAHVWADDLAEAAARTGGRLVADDFVDAAELAAELAR